MRKEVLLTGIVLVGALSGCTLFNDSNEDITIVGEINATDDSFRLEGNITNGARGEPPTFHNVTVYLYTQNKTLIASKEAGTLVRRVPITMYTNRIPYYIVINSPEFWQDNVEVDYFKLGDNKKYIAVNAVNRDELPIYPTATENN